jgi:hypothetical protein
LISPLLESNWHQIGLVSHRFLAYTFFPQIQRRLRAIMGDYGRQLGQMKTGDQAPVSQTPEHRLDSWKEIAAYLGRDIRTVRRWEAERGLPIHRVPGGGRAVVFAFRGEIQNWLRAAEGESRQQGQFKPAHAAEDPTGADSQDLGSESLPAENESQGSLAVLPSAAPGGTEVRAPLSLVAPLQPLSNLTFAVVIGLVVIAGAATIALLQRSRLAAAPAAFDADKVPVISAVNSILPQPRQRIVIQGKGFGLHVPYARTDSPFLAIRDLTAKWAAGRIIPQNWDEVTLDVESWTDNQIVVGGFSGSYGPNGWTLNFADKLEIAVWNPQSGVGPALYHAAVVSADARR